MECKNCKSDLSELRESLCDWRYVDQIVKCPNCGKKYKVCGDEGYLNGQQYETFWLEPIN